MISGKNYIGQELSAGGETTFTTYDPLSERSNPTTFYEAAEAEINEAVRLATEAFASYGKLPGARKAEFLQAIADEILALGDTLIETYCSETGLPQGRAQGERGRTVGQLRAFADLVTEGSWVEASVDHAQADRKPMPKPDLRKMLVPLGPVAVFGASNFPLAYSTAGGDTAAALAAGCPVVVKSHPMHAGTGELVASAIVKAAKNTGMPHGVFSNLNSSGIAVGTQLVQHPGIKAVGFTGSIGGGRALFDLASRRKEPIPVFAEMGSVNPVVLFPEALRNSGIEWAKTYAASITLGSGQFCTNPGLLLGIKDENLSAFADKLAEEILKIDPSSMLHPNIKKNYEGNRAKALSQEGLSVLARYDKEVGTNFAGQTVALVDGKHFLEHPVLHQEVFGPYSLIVQCADAEELQQIIAQLEGQLTGTILAEGDEAKDYGQVILALQNRVGRLIFNGVPTGVEVCASMQHGGPYPASTDSRFTAVGVHSIKRWARPVSYQDWPDALLPSELQEANPLGIRRQVDGMFES